MEDIQKRSEPELDLSLKRPVEEENVYSSRVPLTLEQAIDYELKRGRKVNSDLDLKRLRRTISNRLSAQRARIKKAEHISELEKKVKDLQDTIAFLCPEIENYKEKQRVLRLQRKMLQEQLDIFTDRSKLRNVQLEETKLELRRLKELAKAQEEHYTMHYFDYGKEKGQSTNFYQSAPTGDIDMEQTAGAGIELYLNFEALNVWPPKNSM